MSEEVQTIQETTTTPKKGSRWKDPAFIKQYHREKRRESRGGLKRHANILPDGRKWSDANPFHGYATQEEYLANKKTYEKKETVPRPKMLCSICGGKEIHAGRIDSHYKSVKHVQACEILKKHGVLPSA